MLGFASSTLFPVDDVMNRRTGEKPDARNFLALNLFITTHLPYTLCTHSGFCRHLLDC